MTSKHIQALERQVLESVNIEKAAGRKGTCLNLKSEWARSMIPGLKVTKPKGSVSNKEELEGFEASESLRTFRSCPQKRSQKVELPARRDRRR